jgi:hypothetical protein
VKRGRTPAERSEAVQQIDRAFRCITSPIRPADPCETAPGRTTAATGTSPQHTMTACRGALVALVLAAIAGHLWTPILHPETAPAITTRGQASLVTVDDAFTADEQDAIARSFSEPGPPPGGKFLRGRHGVTHFILDGDRLDRLVVLATGIGTTLRMYDEFVAPLLAADCAVLRCVRSSSACDPSRQSMLTTIFKSMYLQ